MIAVLHRLKLEIKKQKILYWILLKAYLVYCFFLKKLIRWNLNINLDTTSVKYKIKVNVKSILIIINNLFRSLMYFFRIHFLKQELSVAVDRKIDHNDLWFIEKVQPVIFRVYSSIAFHLYLLVNYFKKRHANVSSVIHVSLITTKAFMLSRLLRKHGMRSNFLAMNADIAPRINIGYDYHIPCNIHLRDRRWMELYYLWAVLARYDVIHFHFNIWLSLANGWELAYLKKMGKVLVFHFRGCDLRQKSINMAVNPDLNCCMECEYVEGSCDTDYQRQRIIKSKEYGDIFFVTTPDLQDFFPEAEHVPFISPYGIDFEKIQPADKNGGIFRVVTSSNHPGIDGVPYVRDAVARLFKEGYPIELIEVIQLPFFEALSIYKSADLFAGKLTMGYYNNANIETMMMGVPNMSYIREEYLHKIPDCPIINARPDNIYEKMKEWIQKPDELKNLGAQGPPFVKKYHDPDVVIAHMIRRYNEAFIKQTGNIGY